MGFQPFVRPTETLSQAYITPRWNVRPTDGPQVAEWMDEVNAGLLTVFLTKEMMDGSAPQEVVDGLQLLEQAGRSLQTKASRPEEAFRQTVEIISGLLGQYIIEFTEEPQIAHFN